MIIDLHNHSYYSDGVLSPSEVVRLAKKEGCDVFALTDHDTTDGLIEAQHQADKIGLNLVHGVEISAMWSNMTVHIVGLGVDINNETLQMGLKQHQEFRQLRAEKNGARFGWCRGVWSAGKNTSHRQKKYDYSYAFCPDAGSRGCV